MKNSISLLLFFITPFLFAQQNVLTAEDVAKIEYVQNAEISEDGNKIAYQLLVPKDPTQENAAASSHLYVYDRGTSSSSAYVTDYSAGNVKFRPGQNTITFTARREGDKSTSLYEIAAGGGEPQKIFEFESSVSTYDWHPKGNKVAFISQRPDESEKTSLPYEPEIYETNLSSSAVFVATLDGTEPKELAVEGHVVGVQWSPEGNRLAVNAAPSSLVDDFYTSQKIYVVDANNLNVTSEIDHKAKLGSLQWSPDGKRIAFIAGEDQHDPIDGSLFIAEATGGKPQIQQRDFQGQFHSFIWNDNKNLTYLASEGVNSIIGTLGVNGKMKTIYDNKDLSITGFSAAKNNRMALVASSAKYPNELFILNPKASGLERITTSNPWLEDKQLGKQEVITYKATDGLDIQGILIHPVNNPSGKIPLITVVHGGPEAHHDNGWLTNYSMPGQVAAGKGYAVFYPNYRGSTGRGIEFQKSSQGDPAGKEFDDIIDGIDYLIKNNNVDEDRVGVTGGSYGGYATAWMATRHTERFAAGVMSVGISNNISKWGTSDIPEEMFLVHSRKRIWDDYQFYLERSPIYYADQAKTPLLIMHGKEDTRVDPGQSFELYRHIKTRTDTPVRLVLYPGEGHGNRMSTARYDFNLRMMRWFDTYLKNGEAEVPEVILELQMN
ncbi:S9 family peptidase [Salinimicrobium xinjiangense]|uniref:S9 family peptidase n=1 Tax=Salinimicrobium xinjiangense TaxID=438596 RepID=UPI000409F8A6|nr:S9 family peptidase [Salinimicrobium xinjiangense]